MSGRRARLARLEAVSTPLPHRDALAHVLHLIGEQRQGAAVAQIRTEMQAGRLPVTQVYGALRPLFRHDVHAFTVARLLAGA